jgi:hypothetical protein
MRRYDCHDPRPAESVLRSEVVASLSIASNLLDRIDRLGGLNAL